MATSKATDSGLLISTATVPYCAVMPPLRTSTDAWYDPASEKKCSTSGTPSQPDVTLFPDLRSSGEDKLHNPDC